MVGRTLSHYEIIEPLGAGGMGEVYLGEDTRLGRKVAIKVLPGEYASDPERLARFEQEARAAAALNHPHIAVVHDIGTEGDTHFIVQEYLEGQSLRERLDKGALPVDKALDLAIEVGEGLTAAHKAGVVHRDLKPDNIFVTQGGHAKILDFGLAKLTEAAAPATGLSMSPTVLGTVAGQVMGTAGYMAPEQVEGDAEIDGRADIFAFGCVLYEMATGKRAFSGESVLDTLHAIKRTEPQAIEEINTALPADLRRIVAKCLAKDPAGRYQHADDLTVDLGRLATEVESGTAAPLHAAAGAASSRWGPSVPLAAAVAVAILSVAAGSLAPWAGRNAPEPALLQLELTVPEGLNVAAIGNQVVTASPDGRDVVLSLVDAEPGPEELDAPTTRRLYRRRLDGLGLELIEGTENARAPAFSPNGEWLAFRGENAQLRKVPLNGGPVITLARPADNGPAWGDDDMIYYTRDNELWRVPAAGGEAERVAEEGDAAFDGPLSALPGSRGILAATESDGGTRIEVIDLETKQRTVIADAGDRPQYSPAGYVLYGHDATLWALPFDLDALQATGPPLVVAQGVAIAGSRFTTARFSVSNDNKLIYMAGDPGNVGDRIAWIDPETREVVRLSGPAAGRIRRVRASSDGSRVLVETDGDEATGIIQVYDPAQATFTTITRDGDPRSPAWSGDSTHVYFMANLSGEIDEYDIYRVPVDLSAPPERLLERPGRQRVAVVSPHDDWLIFIEPTNGGDAWLLPLDGGEPRPLLDTPAAEAVDDVSPDGTLFSYSTNRSGVWEEYVRPVDAEGVGYKISTDQALDGAFSPDGTRFYYWWGALRVVDLVREPELRISAERVLPQWATRAVRWDIVRDDESGRDLLLTSDAHVSGPGGGTQRELVVVTDWLELLDRLGGR